MITVFKKHSKYADSVYEFIADNETDITNAETTTRTLLGHAAGIHSMIHVVSSGNKYFRDSNGNWNKFGGN